MMLQHEVYRCLDSICSSCHDMCEMLFPASEKICHRKSSNIRSLRSSHLFGSRSGFMLTIWLFDIAMGTPLYSLINGGFYGRIIYKWSIFHCYVTNNQRVTRGVHGVPAVHGVGLRLAAGSSQLISELLWDRHDLEVGCSSGVSLGVSP